MVGQLGNAALSMAAQPQFTHLFAIGDRRGANSVYQVTTGWLILLTWPLYLLAVVYGPTVLVIFGHSYRAGSTVMVILGLAMLVATGCGQVDMVLTTTGRTSWSLLNGLTAVGVNVGIDLALIPRYGITGAAIGWAAAIGVTNLVPLAQVASVVRVHPFGKGTLIACVLTTISFGIIPLTLRSLAGGQLIVTAIAVAIACLVLAAGAWQFREPLQLALLPGFSKLTARRMLAGGAAAGLVAVAAAGAVLLLRQHQHHHAPRPGATPPAAGRLADRFPGSNLALVPAGGAYLGAYVQPAEYTSRGTIAAMRGFERSVGHPVDLVHVYDQWEKPFPTAADRFFVRHGKVLLLTWGGSPDTKAIIAGRDDAMIRARAEAVKRLGRPILMEFRHEMDRPNLQWTIHGPANYIKAWDHVRAIFTAAGATNVSWVWCPTGFGFEKGRAQAFYPGNSEVDWVCADVYANSTAQPLRAAAGPFLRWARHTRKPVIIGEFAVKGDSGGWGAWLTAAGKLARSDRQIRAMAYFDGNGFDSNGHPFAYRLDHRPRALEVFGRLLGQPFFQPRAGP